MTDVLDHPGAPATGTTLCDATELDDRSGKGFEFGSGKDRFRLFVIRLGNDFHAYTNECPHAFTPLDWEENSFFSYDSRYLVCATHGAQFVPESGLCKRGPCKGKSLKPVPIDIVGTTILIGTE